MGIKQTDRLIQIDTSLGSDTFIVLSFNGSEQISQLFGFQLQLASEKYDITFDQLAGKNVTVSTHSSDGTCRYFNGIIVEFSPLRISENDDHCVYSAVMVPALWTLQQSYDCRIFQNKTVPDIIAQVLSSSELGKKQVRQTIEHRMDLSAAYLPREYCVQYNESDYDFIARLCEQEGIFYFFEHQQGKHTIVFADAPDKNKPYDAGKQTVRFQRTTGTVLDKEVLFDFNYNSRLANAKFVARDFNFKIPNNDLTVQHAAMQDSAHDVGERYEYPGGYEKTQSQGQDIANIRMQERDAQVHAIRGKSNCRGFIPGFRFTLDEYPIKTMNGKDYLFLIVSHRANQEFSTGGKGDKYENQFVCIPHKTPFRPARKTAKPVISGVQTAIVTGPPGEEIHTDEHGRVKVQFHWDRLGKNDDQSSCWIRVSQGWAGSGWGAMHIPRVGQEVIVDFLEGDPDRPIITGRVYNAASTPTYSLPADKTKSTLISSSTPGGNGSNEIRFEDKAGSEEIYLHGQKDWDIAIENDKSQKIGNNETMNVAVNRTKSVGSDQSETIGKNKTIQVGKDHTETIAANMTLGVGATRTVNITSSENKTIGSSASRSIGKSASENVGKNMSVNVGAASAETIGLAKALTIGGAYQISVGAAMNETVIGLKAEQVGISKSVAVAGNFSETVGETHELKAKKVMIEAEEEITFKTGSSSIVLTSDGNITIKGTKIAEN